MAREPDRAGLLADGPADSLANPPMRIGDKFHAALRLKLVDRAEQLDAFLDQVEHRHAAVAIVQGAMNDQAEIGLDHLRFGLLQGSLGPRPGPRGRMQDGVRWLRLPGGG